MSRWNAQLLEWEDKDVFIIGGGNSLRTFDWDVLKQRTTLGCNQAYELGAEICNAVIFGDMRFFTHNRFELDKYKGIVSTLVPGLYTTSEPWIKTFKRVMRGISLEPTALAWNTNTGAAAINLALLAGAKRIYLLGFDNVRTEGNNNWHDKSVSTYHDEVQDKHKQGLELLAEKASVFYPHVPIYNTSPVTRLECFERITIQEALKQTEPEQEEQEDGYTDDE